MTYDQIIAYLYSRLPVFHQIGAAAYKPGLDNTIRLMEALGNPHLKFRSVHVAGTNGKGSVSHLLAAVFQSAGLKTGLYTSPHLVDFGERIRTNGAMIDRSYVIDFVEKNISLFDEIQPSFFEATMAMAFSYFAECKVDIAVVEVGLGGRLDSTNIIAPELSVITNISFDHVGFLGDTLEKIAAEKAGIIKPETPVVIGEWSAQTRPVFEQKATAMSAPLFVPDAPMTFCGYDGSKMLCKNTAGKTYKVGLAGDYQLYNVATALKTIEVFQKLSSLGSRVTGQAISTGLEMVTVLTGLRGRWEIVGQQPLVIADTGHNVAGISYVTEQLKRQNYDKLHIVIGMVNDKDISHVLELLPANAAYYFTQAGVARALPAQTLKTLAAESGLQGVAYTSVIEAYNAAKMQAAQNDVIFVGGSNFVVGDFFNIIDKVV
jgi:dihydrofolate synthase/folylpolyglutamate synthase